MRQMNFALMPRTTRGLRRPGAMGAWPFGSIFIYKINVLWVDFKSFSGVSNSASDALRLPFLQDLANGCAKPALVDVKHEVCAVIYWFE